MNIEDELRELVYTINSTCKKLNEVNKSLYKANRDLNEKKLRTEALPQYFGDKLEEQLKSLSEHADWLRLNGPIILEEARINNPEDEALKREFMGAHNARIEELKMKTVEYEKKLNDLWIQERR
jgi:hypothetical protein